MKTLDDCNYHSEQKVSEFRSIEINREKYI